MNCHCHINQDPADLGNLRCFCNEESDQITAFGDQGIMVYIPESRMRGMDVQQVCDNMTAKLNDHFDSGTTIYVEAYEGECFRIDFAKRSKYAARFHTEIEEQAGKLLTQEQMAASLFSYGVSLSRLQGV
jgi:hypothetical protein